MKGVITIHVLSLIIMACIARTSAEGYIESFIFDMKDTRDKVEECENKVNQLKEEVEIQKNKTKGDIKTSHYKKWLSLLKNNFIICPLLQIS